MAFYNLNEEANAILQIQRILRDISYLENQLATVRLSGVYDEETRQGVRDFQKKYGLSETGNVDYTTWQLLHSVDKSQKEAEALARAVYILPRQAEYTIYPGLKDNVVYVIQHMLETVGHEYDEFGEIQFSGIYDDNTQNAIKSFQRKSLLDDTGIIDPITFNRLADEYERINSYNQ